MGRFNEFGVTNRRIKGCGVLAVPLGKPST